MGFWSVQAKFHIFVNSCKRLHACMLEGNGVQTSPLSISRTFSSLPKETLYQLSSHSPQLGPWQPLICLLSRWICLFSTFHTNEIIQCAFLCLAYFTQHNVLKVHPCHSMCQYFIPFNDWIICHILFIHSSVDGYLSCFHLLAIVKSGAVNFHVQIFVWTPVFNSFGYIPRSGITGSYGNSIF